MNRKHFALAASLTLPLLLLALRSWADDQPELAGTSPGERAAIESLCGSERSAMARQMCESNQVLGLARRGRKPDLSVAPPDERAAIEKTCGQPIPADRFACERAKLTAAGLPVRNEAGGGPLRAEIAATGQVMAPVPVPHAVASPSGFPTFALTQWRRMRPPMPPEREGPALSPAALYDRVAPSVYIVVASDQPVELAEREGHAQGSAVAITDHVLLTNCHVVAGRPNIRITQHGLSGRATILYADPAGDRCFLKTDEMAVHPIHGVRRFDSLKVGEPVFSLGTPSGLELSFGEGLVAGLRLNEGVRMIQNSAPSWHGSSGGGLFDARGNLVGITTSGSTTVANMNFSIAAEDFWP
jgi:hypothetical protein